MKVTVIKDKNDKANSIVSCIIMFVFGFILLLKANQVVTVLFLILGAFITLYGIFEFIKFFRLKNQFHTEDENALLNGVIYTFIGIIIIFISSFLSNAIQVVTGLWLILLGIGKINILPYAKEVSNQLFIKTIIHAILFFIFGFYTLLFKNVILMFIGAFLILSALSDLIVYFAEKKK